MLTAYTRVCANSFHLIEELPADPAVVSASVGDLVPEHVVVDALLSPVHYCSVLPHGAE